jgi:Arc/MetJ-type ribon-helix-helix transcriptional regulator
MTINLPKDLENPVRAEVLKGHFPSEDDLVAAAVRAYLGQQPKEQPHAKPSGMGSIGAMHDDAELLEQITLGIMHSRETRTLRLPPDD